MIKNEEKKTTIDNNGREQIRWFITSIDVFYAHSIEMIGFRQFCVKLANKLVPPKSNRYFRFKKSRRKKTKKTLNSTKYRWNSFWQTPQIVAKKTFWNKQEPAAPVMNTYICTYYYWRKRTIETLREGMQPRSRLWRYHSAQLTRENYAWKTSKEAVLNSVFPEKLCCNIDSAH